VKKLFFFLNYELSRNLYLMIGPVHQKRPQSRGRDIHCHWGGVLQIRMFKLFCCKKLRIFQNYGVYPRTKGVEAMRLLCDKRGGCNFVQTFFTNNPLLQSLLSYS